MEKPSFYYLKITNDEYELPLAVADSAAELARIVGGVKPNTIMSIASKVWHGKIKRSCYVKVPREEDDIDEMP